MIARVLMAAIAAAGLLATAPAAHAQPVLRDGAHDFDFKLGVWSTHIRRLVHPLSGTNETIELAGVVTVRPVWGGRGALEEIEADGPNGHWEGLTLFLYDPQSRQWRQSFANSRDGQLAAPLVGAFQDGRGEMYSADTFGGRAILVRGVWAEITADRHTYQESYSSDGGRTWELVFDAVLQRRPG